MRLVTVLETSDAFAANLAKATLEDAGIEYVTGGDDIVERALTGMSGMGATASTIQVEAAHADAARDVLEPLLNPLPIGEDEAQGS